MVEHGFVDDDSLGWPGATCARRSTRSAATRGSTAGAGSGSGSSLPAACSMGSFLDPVPDGWLRRRARTYAAVATRTSTSRPAPSGRRRPTSTVRCCWCGPSTTSTGSSPPPTSCSSAAQPGRAGRRHRRAGAHHGFETVDDTDESRAAVRASIDWWADRPGPVSLSSSAAVRAARALHHPLDGRSRSSGRATYRMSRRPCSCAADSKTKWPKPRIASVQGLGHGDVEDPGSAASLRALREHTVDPEHPHVGDHEAVRGASPAPSSRLHSRWRRPSRNGTQPRSRSTVTRPRPAAASPSTASSIGTR